MWDRTAETLPGTISGDRVRLQTSRMGVPAIIASTPDDAAYALGWLHARDRAFQMDCIRRTAAGRLAEIFGPAALARDRLQRRLGTLHTAREAVSILPPDQHKLAHAYAEGVNARLASKWVSSPCHLLTGSRRMEPWREIDTLLALMSLYQSLSFDLAGKLTERRLRANLPGPVASFLLSSSGSEDYPPVPPQVVDWLRERGSRQNTAGSRRASAIVSRSLGSNCWTVSGDFTASGRPMLACDTHLAPALPGPWYRIEMRVGGRRSAGITIPGIPMMPIGCNGFLAWGLTNLPGDTLDLVSPDEAGPPTANTTERILVRGKDAEEIACTATAEGPLLPAAGETDPLVVRWSGLWPSALDLGLARVAWCETLDQGLEAAQRSGGPPVYFHLAHASQGIAMTIAGRVPLRRGGRLIRYEYLPASHKPVEREPGVRILVSANDSKPPESPFHGRGWNHPPDCRARRIEQVLRSRQDWSERSFLALQLDVRAAHLDPYRSLAQEAFAGPPSPAWPAGVRIQAEQAVDAWDGCLKSTSRGAPLLQEFASRLSASMLAPFLETCTQDACPQDEWEYSWRNTRPIVRSLLDRKDPTLAGWRPDICWSAFLDHHMAEAAIAIVARHAMPLDRLTWGEVRKRYISHPVAEAVFHGAVGRLPLPAEGDEDCVLALGDGAIPTQRFAVTPGDAERALFSMIGGQSENPFSRNYRDHHRTWLRGEALPFLSSLI